MYTNKILSDLKNINNVNKDLKVIFYIEDKILYDNGINSRFSIILNYAISETANIIVNKIRSEGYYVKVIFQSENNIENIKNGYNQKTNEFNIIFNYKDCRITLGEQHLDAIFNLNYRDIELKDLDSILYEECKNFTTDRSTTKDKYLNIIKGIDKQYICKIIETKNKEFVGYIRYINTDTDFLSNKYPNAIEHIKDIKGNILYISTIVIIDKFKNLGIGSALLSTVFNSKLSSNFENIMAFAVKDGINGKINSLKLFKEFDFIELSEINDAWNQTQSEINYCPICDNLEYCKCSAIVLHKKLY